MSDDSKFRLVSEWLGESLLEPVLFEVLDQKCMKLLTAGLERNRLP